MKRKPAKPPPEPDIIAHAMTLANRSRDAFADYAWDRARASARNVAVSAVSGPEPSADEFGNWGMVVRGWEDREDAREA